MTSTKKLIQLARKWQRIVAAKRKKLTWQKQVAEKGHFIVYTEDRRRFMIPLTYLKSEVVRELLVMGEEEFGVTSDGAITLPCDSIFMEYIISILQRQVITADLETALILSLTTACNSSYSSSYSQDGINPQVLISSY